jgi:hypothetical protein
MIKWIFFKRVFWNGFHMLYADIKYIGVNHTPTI